MSNSGQQIHDSGKRKYSSPTLISYGSVAKLTQNVGSVLGDSGPLSMATCL